MRISQRVVRILLVPMLFLLMGGNFIKASAAQSDIILKTPVAGFPYRIYKIGEISADGAYVLQGAFADSAINMNIQNVDDATNAARALSGYVDEKGIAPDSMGQSDGEGMATLSLTEGALYMIKEESYKVGGTTYRSVSRLFTPSQIDQDINGDRILLVKYELINEGEEQEVSYTVRKVWDDGQGERRPGSITVCILKNGQVFDRIVLSGDNNWTDRFTVLDDGSIFNVMEENVPGNYQFSVSERDHTFVINNVEPVPSDPGTGRDPENPVDPTNPTGNSPKMGDISLRWPIILLVLGGSILLLSGMRLKKSNKRED